MSDIVYLDQFRSTPRRADFVRAPSRVTPEDRDERCKRWDAAAFELEYWSALRRLSVQVLLAEERGWCRAGSAPHLVGTDLVADANEIISRERSATKTLLLTPAPFDPGCA